MRMGEKWIKTNGASMTMMKLARNGGKTKEIPMGYGLILKTSGHCPIFIYTMTDGNCKGKETIPE